MPDLSDSIPVKISIGDGRYVDAEEVMRLFSFPRAETPEELAKINAKTLLPNQTASYLTPTLMICGVMGDSTAPYLPLKSTEGYKVFNRIIG